jgi:hypothetical protein
MSRPKTEAALYKKLMLRLPVDVLQACRTVAEKNCRSLNAQILYVLIQDLEKGTCSVRSHQPQGVA